MANSQLPLKLLWVTTIVTAFLGMVSAEQRQCAQCTSGNFLNRQWLMQDSAAGQSMGWVHQWPGTDCATGTLHIIKCYHACITVLLETFDKNGKLFVDGMMKDCSDDLIQASPDLPEGVDYRSFSKNATYIAHRSQYKLTYNFTLESFKSEEHLVQELASFQLPDSYMKRGTLSATKVLLVGIIVFSVMAICLCVKICRPKKKRTFVFDTPMELENRGPSSQSSAKKLLEPKNDRALAEEPRPLADNEEAAEA